MSSIMKEMQQHNRRRLLNDFLIPALNEKKYPEKLYWINKEERIFRLYWSHKNAAKWQEEDTIVFQDWDKLKGRYFPKKENYYMSSKQRFRAALYKLQKHVVSLKSLDKTYRDYQLKNADQRKSGDEKIIHNVDSSKTKAKIPKKVNQGMIRPSVIHKNTSYVEKPTSSAPKPRSPSPVIECATDESVIKDYKNAIAVLCEMKRNRQFENTTTDISRKRIKANETSVLKENSTVARVPHVPSQQTPTYSCKNTIPFLPTHFPMFNSPQVFMSRLYDGPENVPQMKDDIQSSMYPNDEETSVILNLSLKSSDSSDVSR